MGYTSEATMDDRSLRDVERWKDKIEVRLDNRQVFFLFFGSALVACLLFILGVIVGKRLESRGKAIAPEVQDPLALLDKVAATPRPTLGASSPMKSAAPELRATAKLGVAPVAAKPSKPAPALAKAENVATAAKAAALVPPSVPKAPPVPPPVAKTEPAEAPEAAAAPAPVPVKVEKAAARPSAGGLIEPPVAKGRYALQLGSFPDRAEAEAFAGRFLTESPYVVPSEIPGKGLWYRVRVGDYAGMNDAVSAKSAFERRHNVIAYVVGPR